MVIVLNLNLEEKKAVLKFLKKNFTSAKTSADFEEARFKAKDCTITAYYSGKLVLQGKSKAEQEIKRNILSFLQQHFSRTMHVGIDECGRSEAEGPFVISAVLGNPLQLKEFRDSKKIKDAKSKFKLLSKQAAGYISITFNPALIDLLRGKGINMDKIQGTAIDSIANFFRELFPGLKIKVDGKRNKYVKEDVKFIIKGDDKDVVIAAASICAKFLREISSNKELRKSWKCKNEVGGKNKD